MLRLQYESVYSNPVKEKLILDPEEFFSSNDAETKLENIQFKREDILAKIDSLSSGAAAGLMAFQPFWKTTYKIS